MLEEYRRKRDFKQTPEPSGKKTASKSTKGKLTFVIQKHAARRLHYDFRLEIDGVMVSWAVPKGPSLNPTDKRLAVMTEDHPMEYSGFEGIIPEEQYGAGEVIIWDRGTYSPDADGKLSWRNKKEANERMREGLKKGKLSFHLKGEKLEGSFTLVKMRDKEKDWLLIKHKDEFENAEKDITEDDESVVSGKTIEYLQEHGADRVWTRKGSEEADPETTGKSARKKKLTVVSSKTTKKPERKLYEVTSAQIDEVIQQLDQDKEKLVLDVDGHKVSLTSLDKIYWPAFNGEPAVTKRDYLKYLASVSPYMVPHLTDRLMTLIRFPNGVESGRFYQKHWEQKLPEFVKTVPVFTEKEDKDQDFIVCNNLATLLWLGQMADLEIHASHTRVVAEPDAPDLSTDMSGSVEQLESSVGNYPDFMVLDLDPYLYSGKEAKGAEPELHRKGFEKCREIAFSLKDLLDALNINSFVKTSGKTGLHIYIPMVRNIDYDTVRAMSQVICQKVHKDNPDETTMEWAVKKRTGKIFLDHNMNARSKSLIYPYSLRVAPNAPVSTPVTWQELARIYPTDFDIRTIPARLKKKGDIWENILADRNDLRAMFEQSNVTTLAAHRKRKSARR